LYKELKDDGPQPVRAFRRNEARNEQPETLKKLRVEDDFYCIAYLS
jgi:hypothetical protein